MGGCDTISLHYASLQSSTVQILMLLSIAYTLHASVSIGVHTVSSFSSFSIFSLPHSRLTPYNTVFFANRPVEKCQSTYMVMVTAIPSAYLHHLLMAVHYLWYGVQPYII